MQLAFSISLDASLGFEANSPDWRELVSGGSGMANAFEAQDGPSTREETIIPDYETSKQFARLDDLKAQATLKYAVKDYNAAAELYSQATELQATINGEMAAENADLLYAYGRCLYHVAVANSDVLGSKVAGETRQDGPSRSTGRKVAPRGDTASS